MGTPKRSTLARFFSQSKDHRGASRFPSANQRQSSTRKPSSTGHRVRGNAFTQGWMYKTAMLPVMKEAGAVSVTEPPPVTLSPTTV